MQYSDDLRQKLVEAWEAGRGTQAELAEWFGVSLSWVEKVLRRWRTTGQTVACPHRHGRFPWSLRLVWSTWSSDTRRQRWPS